MHDLKLAQLIDREDLFDLVRRERFARDRRRFDMMRDCFHADAHVVTSWYDGVGADAYVEATRSRMARGGGGTHWVFPTLAEIEGDRATVESPALIASRTRLHGVEVDFQVYCRFFSRAVRQDGNWRLLTFRVLFERDILSPVDPDEALPVDRAVLAKLRPSYKHIAYIQQSRGVDVDPDHMGDDRLEELDRFYAGERAWLTEQ